MQQLATFQLDDDDVIATLSGGMTDLLAQQKGMNATQQDAVSIGNMVGKVMTGQTSALKRVGISFSSAQEKALKMGTAQEKAAVLAEVLKQNVGGVNKALAETDQGKIQQAENTIGDMQEQVGMRLLPLLASLSSTFLPLITVGFDKILAVLDMIAPHAQALISQMGSGIGAFLTAIQTLGAAVGPTLVSIGKTYMPIISGAIQKIISSATSVFNFISSNWSQIGPIARAIGIAIVGIKILISKVEILDDKTVRCLATISNAGLTESYCIKEVGVYIESDGGETLYSISTAKDEIEMPLESEVGMYQINFNFYQKISTGDINIRVANEAYVSTEDFEPVSKAVDEIIDNVNIDQRDSGCDYIFSQIKFLNDNFIAISNSGRWASISSNGEAWEGTIVSGKYIYDITYGAGLYVSVGQEIMTSSDGMEWTKRGTISEGSLLKVIYENNRFIAVGDWGLMMSSLDGIVWETIQVPTGENLREIIYEKQLYLAAGNKNTILYSVDGIQWSVAETDPNLKPNVGKIIYKNNIFVALCGDYAGYSEDGIHWSITSEFRARMNDICFGNGLFVACGAAGAIYTSQDGKTWNESPYPYPRTDSDYFYEITYGNELFITVGSQGKIATSPDGTNWTQRIAPYNGYLNCVGYAKNIFVIGGNEGKLITCDHSKYKKMEDMKQQISELNSALELANVEIEKKANQTDLSGHIGNKNNPHSITKAQIGLSKVQNSTIKIGYINIKGVPANGYKDVTVNHNCGVQPLAMANFFSTSTNVNYGNMSVSCHSANSTSITIRVWNSTGGDKDPTVTWIAIG